MPKRDFIEGIDYYLDKGFVIMTEHYHKERGFCCGSKCRHCVFEPIHVRGAIKLQEDIVVDKKPT